MIPNIFLFLYLLILCQWRWAWYWILSCTLGATQWCPPSPLASTIRIWQVYHRQLRISGLSFLLLASVLWKGYHFKNCERMIESNREDRYKQKERQTRFFMEYLCYIKLRFWRSLLCKENQIKKANFNQNINYCFYCQNKTLMLLGIKDA